MATIKKVCILGGTHGNELSGVLMVKKTWKENPEIFTRPSFTTMARIANPKAVEANKRYIDLDLNRSFSPENLAMKVTDDTPYEIQRVQELKAMLAESGEIGPCDLILDLHNTTSNTKVCLIHRKQDGITAHMMHYVMSRLPEDMCRALFLDGPTVYNDSRTLAFHGIAVEVGPQPQGVLRADIFQLQQETLQHCLDFVEELNKGTKFPEANLPFYKTILPVPFPRDDGGDIISMIHPNLQDQDFNPISADSQVFLSYDGKTSCLKDVIDVSKLEGEVFYPVFVNEGAYYEKNVAFILTTKHDIPIPELQK